MKLIEIQHRGKSFDDLDMIHYDGVNDINCSSQDLTSLKGSPQKMTPGTSFFCSNNALRTLEGAPQTVGSTFDCSRNFLVSLEGGPKVVRYNYFCYQNKLQTLEGAPNEVGWQFVCSNNALVSLKGAPQKTGSSFTCTSNLLKSIDGVPSEVGGGLICDRNKITNFHDIHKQLKSVKGRIVFDGNPITSHVLGLLMIEGVTRFTYDDDADVRDILNYALFLFRDSPKKRVLYAQKRLLDEHENGQELAKL